nr:hypothetical protein [Tanacetum cinerariifolium]
MVAILEKSEHNIDFHPMVDFAEAFPLRIETTEEGTEILATVDGVLRIVTESSLRRNLKLQDEEGISSLPDTELFENLTLVARELKEQLAREDQRRAEQIARDAEIARIHAEEELQSIIEGSDNNNKIVAKYLEEYRQFSLELPMKRRIELISDLVKYQDNYTKVYKFHSQQRKSWTKKQKRDYYMAVIRNNLGWKLWSLVTKTFSKRLATSDKEMELWVELSRLYEPNVEDQLWTHTQNFMHAPAEWKLYDKCRVHQLTSKDKDIFMLVEKDYPLRKGPVLVMICYKLQVENYSQMADDLV